MFLKGTSRATEKAPSSFEIVFILDNEMYRYGFESNEEMNEILHHLPMPDSVVTKFDFNFSIETLWTLRKKYAENGNFIQNEEFTLNSDESAGTQKYFALAGPILEALSKGSTSAASESSTMVYSLVEEILKFV